MEINSSIRQLRAGLLAVGWQINPHTATFLLVAGRLMIAEPLLWTPLNRGPGPPFHVPLRDIRITEDLYVHLGIFGE